MRAIKNCRGVISIFVALMMTGILSLGTFVLEAARLQAARTQLAQATDSAASSMLSTYNLDLQARYGIFAIDAQRANKTVCRDYVEYNSDLAADSYGNNVTRLYKIEDVDMTGIYNLTYPRILKRQLLTVAKYNLVPEESQFNMYTASYVLDELQMKCCYVSDMMAAIQNASQNGAAQTDPQLQNALQVLGQTFADMKKHDEKHGVTISSQDHTILPSVTGTVESAVPEVDKQNVNALLSDASGYLGSSASVLGSSTTEVQQSDVNVNLEAIHSLDGSRDIGDLVGQYKNLAEDVNAAINILKSDLDGNLLLNSYISQMFSNRMQVADQYIGPGMDSTENGSADLTFAKACCEYIFGGSVSEVQNQDEAYDYIMAIRLIGNLYAVFSGTENLDVTDSGTLKTLFAWAYYETCVDMQLLTRFDTPVPLTKDELILPIDKPDAVTAAFADKNVEKALDSLGYYNEATEEYVINGIDCLDYTDSLSLSLWLVPNSEKILRVADLMQLEMRYKQRYVDKHPVTFLMKDQNTYCRVECKARMNSILPILSIGGAEYSLQELPLSTMKYAGY